MGNKAIIWDFDGTLVDTRRKNFSVTKRIMHHLLGVRSDGFAALRSPEHYIDATRKAKNWRELYRNEFGMSELEIDEAGTLWTEFQLSDDGESTLFEGIDEVVRSLNGYPNLIFSQNSKENIARVLQGKDLLGHFVDIIGYEELVSGKQKPAPDGLLLCIGKLETPHCESVFFIGDHETDTLCGHNANEELKRRNSATRIITVAAFYGSDDDTHLWSVRPDHIVTTPRALTDWINGY